MFFPKKEISSRRLLMFVGYMMLAMRTCKVSCEKDGFNAKLGLPDTLWRDMAFRFLEVIVSSKDELKCHGVPWTSLPPPNCKRIPSQLHCGMECTKLDVLITSPGGTGSSYTLKRLKNSSLKTNNPKGGDLLKHQPRPMIPSATAKKPHFKNLYIFGTPKEAIYSHFRRGFVKAHARKVTGCANTIPTKMSSKDFSHFAKTVTHDPLRFGEHLLHWLYDPAPYARIFVNGMYQDALQPVINMLLKVPIFPSEVRGDPCRHTFYVLNTNVTLKPFERHPFPNLTTAELSNLERVYGCMEFAIRQMPLLFLKLPSATLDDCPTVPTCLPGLGFHEMLLFHGHCVET